MPCSAAMPASVAEKFFKCRDGPFGLGMMLRPGRELTKAHRAQLTAQGLRRDRDAELLPQPLPEIAQPPAHHALGRGDRTAVDLRRQRLAVRVGQQRRRAWCATVDQPRWPLGIEAHHPVANDLQGDMAQPRRLRARATIIYRGQGKQAPGLGRVLAPPRQATELSGAEVGTKGDCAWHGEPPRITRVNHITAVSGNPPS